MVGVSEVKNHRPNREENLLESLRLGQLPVDTGEPSKLYECMSKKYRVGFLIYAVESYSPSHFTACLTRLMIWDSFDLWLSAHAMAVSEMLHYTGSRIILKSFDMDHIDRDDENRATKTVVSLQNADFTQDLAFIYFIYN